MNDKQDDKAATPKFINANRRGFLQGAAVAGGVAATGAAAAADLIDVEVSTETQTQTKSGGYQETDHVKKYYKRARF